MEYYKYLIFRQHIRSDSFVLINSQILLLVHFILIITHVLHISDISCIYSQTLLRQISRNHQKLIGHNCSLY